MMRSVVGFGMVALCIAGALALGGCAPASRPATPTTPASPSASPSASPTASRPTLSQLVVTPDALGYLVPGAAVPTESAATAIMTFNPTKCVSVDGGVPAGSPGAGAWVPNYPDSLIWSGSGIPFNLGPMAAQTDPIQQIQIWSPELKTAKGIGAGSTAQQLTAAYGSALTLDSAANSDVYVLRGTHSELLFEVAKTAAGLPTEETGTVVWMRIVPLGTGQLHIANSDGSGACAS